MKVIRHEAAGEAARYAASLVLVRPDHFVTWTGDNGSADPSSILRKAVGVP